LATNPPENLMNKITACCVVATLTSLAGLTACAKSAPSSPQPAATQGDEATPQEAQTQAPAASAPQVPDVTAAEATDKAPMVALNDAQIAKITASVDIAEIAQAQVASARAQNASVKQFAAHMIAQHTQSKQQGAQLAQQLSLTPEDSSVSTQLGSKADATLAGLKTADAASFDTLYMNAQVQQHREVLNMIDSQLLTTVTSAQLKAQLTATRTLVQHHIEQAEQIQRTLTGGAAAK
jgi:putative membrane protein